MPIESPLDPEYLSHPAVIPASNVTFRQPLGGINSLLYLSDCISNISIHGILIIRIFLSDIIFAVSIANDNSEPVAIKMISGLPSQSLTM